jgi:hypothetical protein
VVHPDDVPATVADFADMSREELDLFELTMDMAGRLKVAAALSGKRPEAWMEFVVSLALNVPLTQLASGVVLAREAKRARAS